MNTKEKIEVMQAWEDGKPIQYKTSIRDMWNDWEYSYEPNWNWEECKYRIKPGPKEIWVNEFSYQEFEDDLLGYAYSDKQSAINEATRSVYKPIKKAVKYREVIDES